MYKDLKSIKLSENVNKGTCKKCGCTNDNACITESGPCWWADESETMCSECMF